MTSPEDPQARAALVQSASAYSAGRLEEALEHLAEAERCGAPPAQVARLRESITDAEQRPVGQENELQQLIDEMEPPAAGPDLASPDPPAATAVPGFSSGVPPVVPQPPRRKHKVRSRAPADPPAHLPVNGEQHGPMYRLNYETSRLGSLADHALVLRQERKGRQAGFWTGVLCYLLLSIRQPPAWGVAVWAVVAFGLIPAVVGYLVGRGQAEARAPIARFAAGFRTGAATMFCYALVSLILVRARLHSPADQLQLTAVVLFVSFTYAVLAGITAGLACALFVRSRYRTSVMGGRT